ncbi:MAG TPA: low molecular weight protein-tyrosine-phosphatase [Burkholderiales bacterium]|nr:low molecular weight protein-tyrosine-phosphatase [Burkholderiales bacterium]
MPKDRIRVLFVCMGNICRSPIAEAVFRRRVEEEGLGDHVSVDSAGTHGSHIGARPDPRAQVAATRRDYDLSRLRARQVTREDFDAFDYVLAMDRQNLTYLRDLSPPAQSHKTRLFLDFASNAQLREVPDPYYGPQEGFELVLDLAEDAARGLLLEVRQRLASPLRSKRR